MMGYGPEDKNAVLELTYNYGVTEYDKGNAYAQVWTFFLCGVWWNCVLVLLLKYYSCLCAFFLHYELLSLYLMKMIVFS